MARTLRGNADRPKETFERALRIQERLNCQDHPDVAKTLQNFGYVGNTTSGDVAHMLLLGYGTPYGEVARRKAGRA